MAPFVLLAGSTCYSYLAIGGSRWPEVARLDDRELPASQ